MRFSADKRPGEIAHMHALLRQFSVKHHHLWFILRTYRTNKQTIARSCDPLAGILIWIRANRRVRKLLIRNRRWMQNDSGIERTDPLLGSRQRIDIDLSNPRLLNYKSAESDEDSLK